MGQMGPGRTQLVGDSGGVAGGKYRKGTSQKGVTGTGTWMQGCHSQVWEGAGT